MNLAGEVIATRARSLQERLDTPVEGDAGSSVEVGVGSSVEDASDVMAEWRDRVADGDREAFLERLELSDRSVDECRRRLAADWPAETPLPEWIDHLEDILEHVLANGPGGPKRDPIAEDEVPFTHLLTAFVEYASDQVEWSLLPAGLSGRAVERFERWLLGQLRQLFAHTLFIEFKTYLATHDRELAFADDPEMPAEPRRYYDSFVEEFYRGELASFFVEYAVLARLLVTTIRQWIETVEEFGSRLAADWTALGETFGTDGELGALTDIDVLGDPHDGGRRVFALTFESGSKFLYKPRDVRIDVAYSAFLAWINDESDLPDLRPLTCLPRDRYGWVEWVRSDECASPDDITRYYRRAGMTICLLHALNFTDGHLENIVAAGDQPVVVDLETLMEPYLPEERRTTNRAMSEPFSETVLRTFVLPLYVPDDDVRDIGGLGESEGKTTGAVIRSFENVNTDVMDLEYDDTGSIEGSSLPRLDGERVKPEAHPEEIARGFEEMYRFLVDRREAILGEGGPLEAFEDAEVRTLYRSTKSYTRTLKPLTTPSYLRSGLEFDCKVEALAKPFAEGETEPEMWPIYGAERAALWRFDVPKFTVETTGTDLIHENGRLEDVYDATPLEQVRRRIERFDEASLKEQLRYLDLAYAPTKLSHPNPPRFSTEDTTEVEDVRTLSGERPREIYERIREHARRTDDGDLTWYIRQNRNGRGVFFHQILHDLYEGRAGVAVFGAALANVFDDPDYRAFAHEVASPLLDMLEEYDDGPVEQPFDDDRIGGGHGVGSFVYAFVKLGQLLDDDRYVHAGRRAASLITPERIEEDSNFDVVGGSAGAILALLALYDSVGDDAILNRAATAGDHLLSNRIEREGVGVWQTTTDTHVLTGFLHGVAGIAYALYKLADATGEARFREAALESIEYERAQFSPERNNWPDHREATDSDFVPYWCAGRSGIGLARLGMYEIADGPGIREEIDRALVGTDPRTLLTRDHICCGNFSHVEFLLRAGRTLDDERYRTRARRLASDVVQRADVAGQFTVPWQADGWYYPSFFRGESGIGYSLLRLAHPELPCVLLWE